MSLNWKQELQKQGASQQQSSQQQGQWDFINIGGAPSQQYIWPQQLQAAQQQQHYPEATSYGGYQQVPNCVSNTHQYNNTAQHNYIANTDNQQSEVNELSTDSIDGSNLKEVLKTNVTPSSSEDDWVKADEVEKTVKSVEKQDEIVREKSGEASGGRHETINNISDDRVAGRNSSERESEVIENKESMKIQNEVDSSVNEEYLKTTPEPKLKMGQNPGEALATSTPKEAVNNNETNDESSLDAEDDAKNDEEKTTEIDTKEFERGSVRESYRCYKEQYSAILKRLSGFREDSNRTEFRPSSKLANPLLAAAGISVGTIRNDSNREWSRNSGRLSVPLPQSKNYNDDMNLNTHRRVSRLQSFRSSPKQYQAPGVNYGPAAGRYGKIYQQGRYSSMGVQDFYDSQYSDHKSYYEPASNTVHEQVGSSVSDADQNGDIDDEVGYYNNLQGHRNVAPNQTDGSEMYYFGIVHIDMDTVHRIMEFNPPPPEYYSLSPIEKAAFIFYTAVYKHHYPDVDRFHKRFNCEFFKYACSGDSNDVALYKICMSMQSQYINGLREKNQKNYEATQKHLFSDDNSGDGNSEITSVYENDESIASVDVYNKAPLKYSHPHAFMTFGVAGKVIYVQPEQSISLVYADNLKSMLTDYAALQMFDEVQAFKGPLIPHITQPHTVRLYITKKIEAIKRSQVARENPNANDVVEALLVWQLLEIMVKQQGNLTGPDVAELLLTVDMEKVHIDAPSQNPNISSKLSQFTKYLLGGHVDEAIEYALQYELYADALVLARRLYPNDTKKITEIEERFLQTRSLSNPVTTLLAVANGIPPPVLTHPPLDDKLSWRTHAAIILANLDQNETAMNTIYSLGRTLAKRDYHCAADFCFLVVLVLAGYDTFLPVQANDGEEEIRRHISLISSRIPDDDDVIKSQFGFSISDLHATEIFDYALHLKTGSVEPLARSVAYQTTRIKYAKLLANYGFAAESYRYCMEICRTVGNYSKLFEKRDLLELSDLAESIYYMAAADISGLTYFEEFRKFCSTSSESMEYSQPSIPMYKTEITSPEMPPESKEKEEIQLVTNLMENINNNLQRENTTSDNKSSIPEMDFSSIEVPQTSVPSAFTNDDLTSPETVVPFENGFSTTKGDEDSHSDQKAQRL